ncbi:MAG: hypothetical protein QM668_00550 [Agriterribacter sp.]
MKYIFILLMVSCFIFSCTGNKQSKTKNIDKELAKLDSLKGSFKPDYFSDANNAHESITVSYKDGAFSIVPGSRAIRPGRVPFENGDKSKPFIIQFKDANGKNVFEYSFIHPGILRVCEGEKPEYSIRDSFTFEILSPAKINAASVSLVNKEKNVFDFRLPPYRDNQDSVIVK